MYIICVDARYVLNQYYEECGTLEEAERKYEEFLDLYKEELAEKTVSIYFTKVMKSTDVNTYD